MLCIINLKQFRGLRKGWEEHIYREKDEDACPYHRASSQILALQDLAFWVFANRSVLWESGLCLSIFWGIQLSLDPVNPSFWFKCFLGFLRFVEFWSSNWSTMDPVFPNWFYFNIYSLGIYISWIASWFKTRYCFSYWFVIHPHLIQFPSSLSAWRGYRLQFFNLCLCTDLLLYWILIADFVPFLSFLHRSP